MSSSAGAGFFTRKWKRQARIAAYQAANPATHHRTLTEGCLERPGSPPACPVPARANAEIVNYPGLVLTGDQGGLRAGEIMAPTVGDAPNDRWAALVAQAAQSGPCRSAHNPEKRT